MLEVVLAVVAALSFGLAVNCYLLARRWARDCAKCRILIARKGKVVLDAPLTEWLAWNRALPRRERARGGVVFMDRGIQVALARPTIGPAGAKTESIREAKPPTAAEVARA